MNRHTEPQYYDPKKHLDVIIERDTTHDDYHEILYKDGVENPDLDSNHSVVNIDEIIKNNKPSAKEIINTENINATLICQNPGRKRRHYHPSWNEGGILSMNGMDIEDDYSSKKGEWFLLKKVSHIKFNGLEINSLDFKQ